MAEKAQEGSLCSAQLKITCFSSLSYDLQTSISAEKEPPDINQLTKANEKPTPSELDKVAAGKNSQSLQKSTSGNASESCQPVASTLKKGAHSDETGNNKNSSSNKSAAATAAGIQPPPGYEAIFLVGAFLGKSARLLQWLVFFRQTTILTLIGPLFRNNPETT